MKEHRIGVAEKIAADQAVQWLCELRDGDDEHRDAFFAWLKESPRHVKEFLLASAVWETLEDVGPKDSDSIEKAVAEAIASEAATNVISLDKGAAQPSTPNDSSGRLLDAGRRGLANTRWLCAAGFAAITFGALVAWWMGNGVSTYHTAIGEQRAVSLTDGSVLYLNTMSRAEVRYSKRARDIKLLKGEALFVVARDTGRPFRVAAGNAVIQALGTQFNVRRRTDDTTVSVLEGSVKIDNEATGKNAGGAAASIAVPSTAVPSTDANSATSNTDPPLRSNAIALRAQNHGESEELLAAGEEARIAGDGRITKHATTEIATAVAWRERRLVFRGNTLAEVAEEFNRYSKHPIRVEGAIARNKRLAGTFNADDPDSLAQFLMQKPDLIVGRNGAEIVIRDR